MSDAESPPGCAPRPLTRAQALENAAFLAELRRTGNAREAARRLGAHRAKFTRRRAKHPAFAAQWEAALALADARVSDTRSGETAGPHFLRRAGGRLQLRRAAPGALDHAARTRFLAALSACANVRLAAKAAGFSHAAFYHHRRQDPAFAREWQLALETGYLRLEMALLEGWQPDLGDHDDWRHNDPPPIPPMSAAQALQLLYLHQKEARLWTVPEPLRKRRGETNEARAMRLTLIYEARQQHRRETFEIAEAARRAEARSPQPARTPASGAARPGPGHRLVESERPPPARRGSRAVRRMADRRWARVVPEEAGPRVKPGVTGVGGTVMKVVHPLQIFVTPGSIQGPAALRATLKQDASRRVLRPRGSSQKMSH